MPELPEQQLPDSHSVDAVKFRLWAETAAMQAERGHWSNVWTIMVAEMQPIADRQGSPDAIRAKPDPEHGLSERTDCTCPPTHPLHICPVHGVIAKENRLREERFPSPEAAP